MPYEQLASAFQNGDVLYGLDTPRAEALRAIGGNRSVTKMFLGCIPYTQTKVLTQNDLTNAVWDVQKDPTKYTSDMQISRTLEDGARGKKFKKFLKEHEKYNVAKQ